MKAAPSSGQQQPLIDFLNQTIGWYRMVNAAQSLASEPADTVFLTESRQHALEAMRLAFQFAKSDAAIASAKNQNTSDVNASNQQNTQSAQAQNIANFAAQADADAKQAQSDLDDLQSKLPSTRGKNLTVLRSRIAEKRSEVDLAKTRSKALNSFVQFLSAPGMSGSKGLSGQIEELQRSVPEARTGGSNSQAESTANASQPATGSASAQKRSTPTGVVALGNDLVDLTRKLHSQRALLSRTNALRDSVNKLRAPLIDQMQSTVQHGDQLAEAPPTNDVAQLQARKEQIEALTAQFKQATDAAFPLGKMMVLLDSESANISEWIDETQRVYAAEVRTLGLRLAIMVLAIGAILLGSNLWQRATFRYVRDVRRRNQFTVLRRFTVMLTITMIVVLALVTEIGSIATFAGFFTAGLAISLQNVILSVVAYFFLIGKYGIRAGDRVQISGITGYVIDVGLVRLHLMEVDSAGAEEQPTGRIVVFSNSVVFQPTASFFRQAPGTNFGWRRVSLTLAPETNYHLAEQRLMSAVENEYSTYRQELERQFKAMQKTNISLPFNAPQPQSRMKISDSGLEMVIRYPVPLDRVSSIDDQVTRALVRAITSEPRLRLAGSGTANIQPIPDIPQPASPASGESAKKEQKGSTAA
ncbi:MAG TPA: mechanosensitive ion channel domain-containing protein [Candidatus Acidoferrales bacterium]|nr:mechanosensitive ion channel domain-containing protein [Candidatus Acidoferrales bacterium]